MNRFALLLSTLVLVAALCRPAVATAAQTEATQESAPASTELPGKEIAQTISLITGVAISPLLGVGAVGAWKYFDANTPQERARLPWFAQPWFWIPALLLVIACFVKDTAGTVLPTAVKKPLDVADAIENKVSGLVATGAFVPLIATFSSLSSGNGDSASLSAMGFAAIDFTWLYNLIMVPVSMIAFFIVFMASNAINVLILLSPFTTVDAALKGLKLAVLGTVAASAWANPWIGAAWALVIIGISYFIAGWSFRLSHFGLVFLWDLLTFRRNRFVPDQTANRMFLGRKTNKVPARTYGTLTINEQKQLVLTYRPWLVLPVRTLTLPEGRYAVGEGAFFSEIQRLEGDEGRTALLLPPRYRSHEEALAGIYGLVDVRPVGLRAAWAWFTGSHGGRRQPAAATP